MGSPTAFKMGPLTNGIVPSKAHITLMLFIACTSMIPSLVLAHAFLAVALDWNPLQAAVLVPVLDMLRIVDPWGRIVAWATFPLFLLAFHYTWAFFAIAITRGCLAIETRRHPVVEGVFPRDMANDAYYHWNARRAIKKFACWLVQLVPFPWMKRAFIYNQLGARIGKDAGVLQAWIDAELVTVGDGASIGRAAMVSSHYLTPGFLILKRVSVGSGAIIGERCRITPGAVIGERATITAKSVVRMDEVVPPGAIFFGNPATGIATP